MLRPNVVKPKAVRPVNSIGISYSLSTSPEITNVCKRLSMDNINNDVSTIDELSDEYLKSILDVHRELSEPIFAGKWKAPIERPEAPALVDTQVL